MIMGWMLFLAVSPLVQAGSFQHLTTSDGLTHPIVRSFAEDREGFVWIGTYQGLSRFDGYQLKEFFTPDNKPFQRVRHLWSTDGVLWVGTLESGVFYIESEQVSRLDLPGVEQTGQLRGVVVHNGLVWLVYDKQIMAIAKDRIRHSFDHPIKATITSVLGAGKDFIWLATGQDVLRLNLNDHSVEQVPINAAQLNRKLQVLHRSLDGSVWLGRSDGVYQLNESCGCFVPAIDKIKGTEIYSLASDERYLWLGTARQGLIQYEMESGTVQRFSQSKNRPDGLNDNSVISLYTGRNDILWAGTFNKGVNFMPLSALQFGRLRGIDLPAGCMPGDVVFDVHEQDAGILWLGTDRGLVFNDANTGVCHLFQHNAQEPNSLSANFVYSFLVDSQQQSWITTSRGVDRWTADRPIFERQSFLPSMGVFFMAEVLPDQFFLGTNDGLFLADTKQRSAVRLTDDFQQQPMFYHHVRDASGQHWFGSTQGMFRWHNETLVPETIKSDEQSPIVNITGLATDGRGGLLIAADQRYLLSRSASAEVTDHSLIIHRLYPQVSIYDIHHVNDGWYWMSSDQGLFRVNLHKADVHLFKESDGLQSNDFLKISSHLGQSGRLYFGGRQGLNGFDPADIQLNQVAPQVVITQLSQLNKPVMPGDRTLGGEQLSKPVNELHNLRLGHQDLAIEFEFAAMNFADASRNQYAYRLLGFDPAWNLVEATERKASYTNLKPGNYTFQVKAADKDGVWSTRPKSLKLTVVPAPWLSAWAFATYLFTFIVMVFAYVRVNTARSRKRALMLEATVDERTREVQSQKQMVESLLQHKNEVFANVTHEFKTPLSLILGPVEELAQTAQTETEQQHVQLIRKNAKRLLMMVGQILKLSEAENQTADNRELQDVRAMVLMLFEAFKPIADRQGVSLRVTEVDQATVLATSDCLEMVVGNLLSNALKFSQSGDEVSIGSAVSGQQVSIFVEDTGSGIKEQDKSRVFQRFTRLGHQSHVPGTGIGLAVVKELTEANGGTVNLSSQWGQGTTFTVTFPLVIDAGNAVTSGELANQLSANLAQELTAPQVTRSANLTAHGLNVLIIEDNLDMQAHISRVLSGVCNTQLAGDGKTGVAQALEAVPDIVICDVMMPEMDGYQVCRVLRHDERTSHIPIILLTALDSKESRIKGWRENIDHYVTKPFDALELRYKIQSVINIRAILQHKTTIQFNRRQSLDNLDLPKQDVRFLKKFKQLISQHHNTPSLNRSEMASLMAMSESQLQRKIKALTGQGALDMLREYRLQQAAMQLKDGNQVGIVSDNCGFNTVSYFASCFKKRYGVTPKKYQQLNKPKPADE
ncbi:ATP-binding protein [Marinicella sediminis]|nr:ATP-binding protein [Marinicella sediminis]